jgi:heptosyltransferase-2
MRTLIIAPDTLGDAVMTQPLVALLRRFDPDGRIDVVAGPAVAAVFESMGDVAQVFASRHAFGPLQPWGKFLLARRLDRHRHDRVFVLPAAKRAAVVPWLAGIPIRIGLHRDTRWGMINQPHDSGLPDGADHGRQVVERFAHLAFDPSHPLPGRVPDPVLGRDERRESVARARAGLADDARILALCVGSDGRPSRRWPARHWAAVVSRAADEWPELRPVLVGEPADRGYATEIAALSGRAPRNLCGEQSLADTLALVAQAEAAVTHDCGLMHAAAAYARPLVAVFGPTDPRFAPPRSPRARVQWLHQPCSPCNAPTCRFGHGQCMSGVDPDTVTAALGTALRFATRDIR